MKLNAGEVASNLEGWYKSAYKMAKQFDDMPVQKAIVEELVDLLKQFRENLPIMEALCHESIQQRHWMELFDAMEVQSMFDMVQYVEVHLWRGIERLSSSRLSPKASSVTSA